MGDSSFDLSGGAVHVWCSDLDAPHEDIGVTRKVLSADERDRARQFGTPDLEARFVRSRAFLRRVLARYLDGDPAVLRFQYGAKGKPSLSPDGGSDRPVLHFNLSHSGKWCVAAVTRVGRIGVDIECVERNVADLESTARRFFSEREYEAIRNLAPDRRRAGFFNCWTRKEAYLKAIGEGIPAPMAQFEVTLEPGEPAEILRIHSDPEEAGRWTLKEFMPSDGVVGAVAVEGRIDVIHVRGANAAFSPS